MPYKNRIAKHRKLQVLQEYICWALAASTRGLTGAFHPVCQWWSKHQVSAVQGSAAIPPRSALPLCIAWVNTTHFPQLIRLLFNINNIIIPLLVKLALFMMHVPLEQDFRNTSNLEYKSNTLCVSFWFF